MFLHHHHSPPLRLRYTPTPRQTVDFKDECLHKHQDVCIEAINAKLAAYPELFEGRDAFEFEVNKVREATDEGYNIVAMRLNPDETTVGGLLGDGMVWFPNKWCLAADNCFTVGPWGESLYVSAAEAEAESFTSFSFSQTPIFATFYSSFFRL